MPNRIRSQLKRLPVWAVIIFALTSSTGRAAPLTTERARAFVAAWANQSDNLESFTDSAELAASRRLAISYDSIRYKFLISYEPDPRMARFVSRCELSIDTISNTYSILHIHSPEYDLRRDFHFRNSLWISPVTYWTRDWPQAESEYFRFTASDTSLLNTYLVQQLDRFVAETAMQLTLTDTDLELLCTQKLHYVLCANEDEMEQLTGYRARGMCNLAFDCVISRFPAHYHELTHQLVNFKLRTLPLYTHPLFQEGLAVALGGRGGKEPGPILDLGLFLQQSGIVGYRALLTAEGFGATDASMSYPVAGLYNLFLIEHGGIDHYLGLYRTHSATSGQNSATPITEEELPADSTWQAWLTKFTSRRAVEISDAPPVGQTIHESAAGTVVDADDWYYFAIADTLLLDADPSVQSSSKFHELFPGRTYAGEHYAVIADAAEISVYDLYTDNLVAKLVGSFCDPPVVITNTEGQFHFRIRKSVFRESLGGR